MLCSVLAYLNYYHHYYYYTVFFLTFRFYIYSICRSIKPMYFVMNRITYKTNKMGEKKFMRRKFSKQIQMKHFCAVVRRQKGRERVYVEWHKFKSKTMLNFNISYRFGDYDQSQQHKNVDLMKSFSSSKFLVK